MHMSPLKHRLNDSSEIRPKLCEVYPGDCRVYLNWNASTNIQARGVESIGLPKDKILCQKLSKAIADVLVTAVRGDAGYIDQTKSARGKLGYVSNRGIIVELFFLSNKTELDSYNAKKWLVAEAIANVVMEHLKNGKI